MISCQVTIVAMVYGVCQNRLPPA